MSSSEHAKVNELDSSYDMENEGKSPFEISSDSEDLQIRPTVLTPKQFSEEIKRIPGIIVRTRRIEVDSSLFVSYKMTFLKTLTWKGSRIHFQFSDDSGDLFHVKLKSRKPSEPIPIGAGSTIHYSQESFAGYLHSTANHSVFSIRQKVPFGSELMSIKYTRKSPKIPRDITMNLFLQDSAVPHELISKEPDLDPDGYYTLSFEGRNVIASVKNYILISRDNPQPYIYAYRVSKTEFRIDAYSLIQPICLFGLGLSLFIS